MQNKTITQTFDYFKEHRRLLSQTLLLEPLERCQDIRHMFFKQITFSLEQDPDISSYDLLTLLRLLQMFINKTSQIAGKCIQSWIECKNQKEAIQFFFDLSFINLSEIREVHEKSHFEIVADAFDPWRGKL